MLRRTILYLFAGVLLTSAMFAQRAGGPAPDFTLNTLDGDRIHLSDYRGSVVVLDFWATWCDPCREEVPAFKAFQQRFGKRGLQVIGISMDDGPAPVRRFYEQYKMNYPVAMGTAKVATAYGGVLGLPLTFLIDRDGRVVRRYEGSADMDEMRREIEKLITPETTPRPTVAHK